jgi:hypothetical protein
MSRFVFERLPKWRDRLVLGALLWRCTYRTRLSHKPLCEKFRRDALRLGRVYVCRSCFCVYTALSLTLLMGAALAVLRPDFFSPSIHERLFAALIIGTLLLSSPPFYRRLPRLFRDITRGGLGTTLGLLFLLPFRGRLLLFVGSAAILIAFWRYYFKLRANRRLEQCEGCPELEDGVDEVCSGYALHAKGARRFEESASAWIMRSGFTPQ